MKILVFGDVVGKPGRKAIAQILPQLKEKYHPDLVTANIENLAHGKGVTLHTVSDLVTAGVDFFTSGNHIYDKPEYQQVFEQYGDKIIRPANFAPAWAGDSWKIITVKGQKVFFTNLLGEVFMDKQVDQGPLTSPFKKIDEILEGTALSDVKIRILDFHADATSEKRAMGFYVDGRMSAVFGTHTHVPTADAQILPGGTGYVTDAGMTGSAGSIIGVTTPSALERFRQHDLDRKKVQLEIADDADEFEISYVVMEIDIATGRCQNINSYYHSRYKNENGKPGQN